MDSRLNNPPSELEIENIKNIINKSEVNNGNITINSLNEYCSGLISRICNSSTTEDSTSVSLDQHDIRQLLASPELNFSPGERAAILKRFTPIVGKVIDASQSVLHQQGDKAGALPIPAQRLSRWEQLADKFVLPMQIVKQIKDGLMSNKIILSDQDADALALGICRIVNDRIIKGPADKINLRELASRDIGKDRIIPSVVFTETSKGKFKMTKGRVGYSNYDCWIEMPNPDQVIVTIDMDNMLGGGTSKTVFSAISFQLNLTKKDRGMDSELNAIARFEYPSDQAEMQINRELYRIAPNAIASPSRQFWPNPAGDVDPTVTTQAYLGSDLDHVIANKTFLPEEMWSKFLPLWEGLTLIHKDNWVHRDIKPANILVPENGVFVFADFGLSQKMGTSSILSEYPYWELASRNGIVLLSADVYGLVMTMCQNYFKKFEVFLNEGRSPAELIIFSQHEIYENLSKILSSQKNLFSLFKLSDPPFPDVVGELSVDPSISKELMDRKSVFDEELVEIDSCIDKSSNEIEELKEIESKNRYDFTSPEYLELQKNLHIAEEDLHAFKVEREKKYSDFQKNWHKIEETFLPPILKNQDALIDFCNRKIDILMRGVLTEDERKCLLSAKIEFLMQSTMASILRRISIDNDKIFNYIDENRALLQPGDELAFCDKIMKELKPTSAADIHKQLQETQSQIEELIKQRDAL